MALRQPLLLLLLLLASASASAFNITDILLQFPDLSNFNSLLSQTKLADAINSRTTVTVLAVDGPSLGTLSGLPAYNLNNILSVHIILDYFDEAKINDLTKQSISLATLYQTSGTADQRQGFVNLTKTAEGSVAFGSAMPGSPMNSNLAKYVMSRPYNISVIQVSSVIVPPGVANMAPGPLVAVVEKLSKVSGPPADAPAKEKGANAPDAAKAPVLDADAPSPVADGPVADGPSASDRPADDEEWESAGPRQEVVRITGVGLVVVAGTVLLGL